MYLLRTKKINKATKDFILTLGKINQVDKLNMKNATNNRE